MDFYDAFIERRIARSCQAASASDRHPSIDSQHSVARRARGRARQQARKPLNAK